ncbi:MAG: alpha/beta hydrolase [Propionibacteriales bacterium]|nr:alpha/beta hydrolase [Propionibacteriales bacterium]
MLHAIALLSKHFDWRFSVHVALAPAVLRWRQRIAEVTAESPDVRAAPLEIQRLTNTRIADRLASEFGLPVDPGVRIDEIELPVSAGRSSYGRRYRPPGAETAAPLPTQVFLHGGAFVFGSPRELVNDQLLSRRAAATGIQIVSVAYGLAPELPYPTGRDDALVALAHLQTNADTYDIDPDRLGLGGNSAGATTVASAALACALGLIADPPRIHHLMLEVPAGSLRETDFGPDAPAELLAMARGTVAALLPTGEIDDAASPADAPSLAGLPPTTVMTAQLDELRTGAARLVHRLQAAGVPTVWHDLPDHDHASCGITASYPAARHWQDLAAAELRAAYRSHPSPTHRSTDSEA